MIQGSRRFDLNAPQVKLRFIFFAIPSTQTQRTPWQQGFHGPVRARVWRRVARSHEGVSVVSLSFTQRHKCSQYVALKICWSLFVCTKRISSFTKILTNESQDSTENICCSVFVLQASVEVVTTSVPTEERSEGSGVGDISDRRDIFRPKQDDVILPPHLQWWYHH